jgi:multiple sugar transport system permease protein
MKQKNQMRAQEQRAAFLFILPSTLGLLVFMVGPSLASLAISFTNWPLIRTPSFNGIQNYITLVQDRLFWVTLQNTAVYTFFKVPINIFISLIIAVLVNQGIKGQNFLRTIFFLPMILSSVAVALIWRPLLETSSLGLVNRYLGFLGLGPIPWLSSTTWSMPSLIIVALWKEFGYFMVIFLAGLQGISRTYYEAAEIDGAGPVSQFFTITIPLISPTTFFIFVTSIIGSFQIFDLSTVLTDGGPANSTNTLVMYIYQAGFRFLRMGYASALAIVLFVIILIFTIIQNYLSKRWVHMESQ